MAFFNTDVVKIVNSILFWFTHGYLANGLFMLSFTMVKPKEMEVTGKLMAFMLVWGISIGSLISAFGVAKINF